MAEFVPSATKCNAFSFRLTFVHREVRTKLSKNNILPSPFNALAFLCSSLYTSKTT